MNIALSCFLACNGKISSATREARERAKAEAKALFRAEEHELREEYIADVTDYLNLPNTKLGRFLLAIDDYMWRTIGDRKLLVWRRLYQTNKYPAHYYGK